MIAGWQTLRQNAHPAGPSWSPGPAGGSGGRWPGPSRPAGTGSLCTTASRPARPPRLLAGLPRPGPVAVQADQADPAAVRAMGDEAAAALGGLDVLVNNAGIFVAHPITEVSYEEWQAAWQQTLAVNLAGPANVTWCAVRHMIPRGGGRIINVSSRGAFRGEPGQPAYGASKAGLNAFGQSLARALGPHGIAVTSVAPGFVATDMAADSLAGPRRARCTGSPARRRSPRPCCTWPHRRPSGPVARSWTLTARPTCGPNRRRMRGGAPGGSSPRANTAPGPSGAGHPAGWLSAPAASRNRARRSPGPYR